MLFFFYIFFKFFIKISLNKDLFPSLKGMERPSMFRKSGALMETDAHCQSLTKGSSVKEPSLPVPLIVLPRKEMLHSQSWMHITTEYYWSSWQRTFTSQEGTLNSLCDMFHYWTVCSYCQIIVETNTFESRRFLERSAFAQCEQTHLFTSTSWCEQTHLLTSTS